MTPKPAYIPIVRWYSLLSHLVGIFYAIVARAVGRAHSRELRTGCQVLDVARVNDTIPRLTDPVLHCFVYPYTT